MRTIAAWVVGVGLAANGLIMLAIPSDWYVAVPGVPGTGPFNAHFVRDIGCAYVVAGVALGWGAASPAARPAAVAAATFLTLHALVHLWDAAAGREHAHQVLLDFPTVFLPPLIAVSIVWPRGGAHNKGDV